MAKVAKTSEARVVFMLNMTATSSERQLSVESQKEAINNGRHGKGVCLNDRAKSNIERSYILSKYQNSGLESTNLLNERPEIRRQKLLVVLPQYIFNTKANKEKTKEEWNKTYQSYQERRSGE